MSDKALTRLSAVSAALGGFGAICAVIFLISRVAAIF